MERAQHITPTVANQIMLSTSLTNGLVFLFTLDSDLIFDKTQST